MGASGAASGVNLATQSETGDKIPVAVDVLALEVVKQLAPLTDHFEQPLSGMVIVDMFAEVIRKLLNSRRKQRYLDLRGSGVLLGETVFLNDLHFLLSV